MPAGEREAPDFDAVARTLRGLGLEPRGGFHPEAADGAPPMPDGRAARTLILAGNVGASMWAAFSASPEFSMQPNPLDRWSRRVLGEAAAALGAATAFPFGGAPRHPFQRWAMRAEPVHPSPLGLLIHPRHGLWHAYRGALLFAGEIALPPRASEPSPCAGCDAKPCLAACPVGAFSERGYDVARCTGHVEGPGVACRQSGCLARRACPVAPTLAYADRQQAFHMAAFLRARSGRAMS